MTARSSFIILTDAGQLVNEKKRKKKNYAWCLVLLRRCYSSGLRPALIIGWQSTSYLGSFRSMRLAEPWSNKWLAGEEEEERACTNDLIDFTYPIA